MLIKSQNDVPLFWLGAFLKNLHISKVAYTIVATVAMMVELDPSKFQGNYPIPES